MDAQMRESITTMSEAPIAAADSAQSIPDAGPAPGTGQLHERPGDLEAIWEQARTLGADEMAQIGAEPPRQPDGKFRAKPKAPEGLPDAKPKEPAKEQTPAEPTSLHEARKLWDDGDVEGALKLAFGIGIDGLGNLQLRSPHFKEMRRREAAANAKIAEGKREAEQMMTNARSVATSLLPVVQAIQALGRGDHAGFVRESYKALGRNDSIEDFLREIAGTPGARAATQPQQPDPAMQAMRSELQQLRNDLKAEREANAKAMGEANLEAYKADVADELEELGGEDPRFARIARKQYFIDKVVEVQEKHWHRGATLPVREAAEEAFETMFGDVVQSASPREPRNGSASRAPGVNGASRVDAGSKRAPSGNGAVGRPRTGTTSLPHTQSAEAAPSIDMSRYDPKTFQENQAKIWDQIERDVNAAARESNQ